MKTKAFKICLILSLLLLLILPVGGEEAESNAAGWETAPSEYADWLGSIPQAIRDLLPASAGSASTSDIGSAAQEMSSFSYFLNTLLSLIGADLSGAGKTLALLCGLLLLSSVCSAFRSAFSNERIGQAFSTVSALVITVSIIAEGYVCVEAITSYFEGLNNATVTLIPLTAVLYTMGGNVTAAISTPSVLSLFLTVFEQLIGNSIVPFCGILMAFSLMRAIDPSIRTGTISDTIKKNYTTFLAFLMMLLITMLTTQTYLSNAKDTLAMKSAKFAIGNLIPVVGGSVSDLLRTVGTGVSYLRGSIGVCAVLILLLTLFPTIIKLLLIRLVWQIAAALADLLGCDREKKLLDDMTSLNGYLIAAAAICSSVVFLALTLLIHSSTVMG